jgi:class 3 adenylate cyclase
VSTGPDETARLERYLIAQGAEPEELAEAAQTGTLGTLALELALRDPGERVPFAEAAARAGLELADAAAIWRALGLPDPLHSSPSVSQADIESLQIINGLGSRLGTETTLQLARVIGGSVAQIAEALVDSFRIRVEMPRHSAGDPYPEIVEDYASTAAVAIPALGQAITRVLCSHLVSVSGSAWGLDSERATVTRERTVGFVDLVGYTSTARGASPAALASTISRFESCVGDVVSRFGGRVVKLIGDEAMFIVGDPIAGCELALELQRSLAEDSRLPAVRIALATGPVVSHHGDYYGDVVNLAARLVKVAEPGELLVSAALAEAGGGSSDLKFEAAGQYPLKGYDRGVDAYRLQPAPL